MAARRFVSVFSVNSVYITLWEKIFVKSIIMRSMTVEPSGVNLYDKT